MLVRYSVENHLSLRREQELSMVASGLNEKRDGIVPAIDGKHGLLTVAAIYGANASGKTNVLTSLQFMKTMVEHSQRTWGPDHAIPRSPFMLQHSEKQPSRFNIDFIVNSIRYQYGFVVSSDKVLEEWLYAYPRGKKQTWFTRQEGKSNPFYINRIISGAKEATKSITRKNSLFLSAAAQNNVEILIPIYDWFVQKLKFVRRIESLASRSFRQCEDEKIRSAVRKYLSWADLGVMDLSVQEFPPTEEIKAAISEFVAVMHKLVPEIKTSVDERITALSLTHRGPHEQGVMLDWNLESSGTIAFLSILLSILNVLGSGGVLVVDELERSLHPLLALRLVQLFVNPATNKGHAQLIFSTHDTNLLRILRRDQIWFTEKDSGGATHLYPLTDFKPRKDENLERGYLQGRYGAIPFLGSTEVLFAPETRK